MLTELKDSITEYLGANPGSSTRKVNEGISSERAVTYNTLCEMEHKGTVKRSGGIDGTTICFSWTLSD